jgi:2-polyprenyl-3-methyl-5-hydroxy-6-metoxy-1,4-benzoquinol methylase
VNTPKKNKGIETATESGSSNEAVSNAAGWDHSSHANFYDYYASESVSEEALLRVRRVRDHILRVMANESPLTGRLDVADIGCGAGTQSMVWAELGHRVHALDINEPLVNLGRKRAAEAGRTIDFRVGSAISLPWADESMDVCIGLELLEHVLDWESCMREFTRVLRPGGALFISTTNLLCPFQAEFQLPLYSWYPPPVKRYYVNLAMTTRPEIANYARYPAFHWFTFYAFRKWLRPRGFRSLDRFDIMDLDEKSAAARWVVSAVRRAPVLRWLGQVCTPGTIFLAIRGDDRRVERRAINLPLSSESGR